MSIGKKEVDLLLRFCVQHTRLDASLVRVQVGYLRGGELKKSEYLLQAQYQIATDGRLELDLNVQVCLKR